MRRSRGQVIDLFTKKSKTCPSVIPDTKYNTFAVQSSAAGGTRYFAQRANPLQFGLDVNIHF